MNTVLITGCSSGFGLDIAKHFLAQGWKVVATMRTPDESVLPASENLRILPLDVRSDESVRQAVVAAGPIDVLVNNAGIGWLNALEGTPMDITRDIFETNTIGTMRTMQADLPQFRERRAGTIVNVTSTVTVKPLPLLSVYTASKAAVNAFTESVALELHPSAWRSASCCRASRLIRASERTHSAAYKAPAGSQRRMQNTLTRSSRICSSRQVPSPVRRMLQRPCGAPPPTRAAP
jgi:NAD(P)-dependent dehydrogenase (short-subunit alcohol dehydrogenase family)